jgi:hypothetical protein
MWWEVLRTSSSVQREVAGRQLTFFVEKTRKDFFYACTIEDVCHLLTLLPAEDWNGIDTFVFRQPTQKQQLLSPSWGRIDYSAELFSPGQAPRAQGPAIFLDAVDINHPMRWSKQLDPDDQVELLRLSTDRHSVRYGPKSNIVVSTYASVRHTQLYRTLPHEIGHWVDFVRRIEQPSASPNADHSELWDRYWARPKKEREAFAHRYADSAREQLLKSGAVPFDRIFHPDQFEGGFPTVSFVTS